MKKLLLASLVFCAWVLASQAQTPYGMAYRNADGSCRLVALQNGKTLVTIGRGPALSLLDSLGGLIWTRWKWQNGSQPIYYPLCVGKRTENSFYAVGGYQSSGFQPVLCRVDASGEILEAKRYVIGGTLMNFVKDLTVTTDTGAVIWSRNGLPGFYLIKAQEDLGLEWAHHYNATGSIQFVKELPGGDLLAGINMDTAGASVARFDAAGNLLWSKSYFRPKGVAHDAVVLSDTSFIITGFTDSTQAPKLFQMNLNGQGEVQWCKGYAGNSAWSTPYGQRTVQATGSGCVMMAQAAGKPVLMKTDANGDTLWTRTVRGSGYYYDTADMIARDDGGYMMSMGVWGGELNGPALMKTDSLGHFPCGDVSYHVQVLDLFPVDSAFILTTTSSGATAYAVSFRDTVFDAMVPEDLCAIVTAMPDYMQPRKPRIHPNPNTGHFTVQFTDPLTANSFYSVYDAVGKLLFQRPLSKSMETVGLDLSSYGKGMYLIRFSDKDGVCSERVVVE